MKAILPKTETSNARQPQNKEVVETISLIGCKANKMKELITARFYMGRSTSASVVYCCLWIIAACGFTAKTSGFRAKAKQAGTGITKHQPLFKEPLIQQGLNLLAIHTKT